MRYLFKHECTNNNLWLINSIDNKLANIIIRNPLILIKICFSFQVNIQVYEDIGLHHVKSPVYSSFYQLDSMEWLDATKKL